MLSKGTSIQASNVSKSFKIVHEHRLTTLGESIRHRVRHPISKPKSETFWALRDLDFEIKQGDVVGLIGRNGAGKSTLLKILSRITAPTTGEINIRGRVGSLLEVGTGFHSELTGRENIFLNGAILGMKKKEIEARFDAIVDFAGIEQFLDTPVKRYSSGMYVRLAFSVAAHLDPEVMIVDEVLAVGDMEFQQKCLGKMQDVASSGRTVIFVSHNMHSIATLCKSAIYLERGRLIDYGPVSGVTERYLQAIQANQVDLLDFASRKGTGGFRITDIHSPKLIYTPAEPKEFQVQVEHIHGDRIPFQLAASIHSERHGTVTSFGSEFLNLTFSPDDKQRITVNIRNLWLRPGPYQLSVQLRRDQEVIDIVEPALRFEVSAILPYPGSHVSQDYLGTVLADFDMSASKD